MDNKEHLKTMLQSIINGKEEEAAATMHDYFVAKTREVTGLATQAEELDDADLSALVDDEPAAEGVEQE